MDAKEQARLPEDVRAFIEQIMLHLQLSRSKTANDHDAMCQRAYMLYTKYNVERRVAEPEKSPIDSGMAYPTDHERYKSKADKCAMCGHGEGKICHHSASDLDFHTFIPLSLAGPRPEPPQGCELLSPGEDDGDWHYHADSGWHRHNPLHVKTEYYWRARRIAEPPLVTVSDHEMLVAVCKYLQRTPDWHMAEVDSMVARFLAQEGGK